MHDILYTYMWMVGLGVAICSYSM